MLLADHADQQRLSTKGKKTKKGKGKGAANAKTKLALHAEETRY
jgi:hypothetical protein